MNAHNNWTFHYFNRTHTRYFKSKRIVIQYKMNLRNLQKKQTTLANAKKCKHLLHSQYVFICFKFLLFAPNPARGSRYYKVVRELDPVVCPVQSTLGRDDGHIVCRSWFSRNITTVQNQTNSQAYVNLSSDRHVSIAQVTGGKSDLYLFLELQSLGFAQ